MITRSEELKNRIDELKRKSRKLKAKHKYGDWDNWHIFINYDIEVKELTKELLQLDIEQLNDSLDTYSDYLKGGKNNG